ncbi:MAG: YhcH/YjgK/YiaL family protein [Paenibacillaceae bacterium]|nr:YhcH/YjgK/YiaL family protein [Paenibacillaceae bacterium]
MIIDSLENWRTRRHLYGEAIERALSYVLQLNPEETTGKVEIAAGKMWTFRALGDTGPWESRKGESHAAHADIFIMLKGEEGFGYAAAAPDNELLEDHLADQDYALYGRSLVNEQRFVLKPGMFAVFYPGEVHRPGGGDRSGIAFDKWVVKIHKSLL